MKKNKSATVDAKLVLSQKAFLKMKYFTDEADGEISGFGKTSIDEDGDILVEDIIILSQECNGGGTEIDDDAQAKFLFELAKKKESPKLWNLWWHSHVNMAVMWSPTDDGTIKEHGNVHSYLISIVTNKKGEYKARLDIFPKDESPFKAQTMAKYELEVEIFESELQTKKREHLEKIIETTQDEIDKIGENKTIQSHCKKEVKEKVREKVYPTQKVSTYDWRTSKYNKCKKHQKQDKWSWHGSLEDPFDVLDDIVDNEMRKTAEGHSKREFNIFGYCKKGYAVNGEDCNGAYNSLYDEIKL